MRFLITTADERSWRFDREVVFLGEWCLRYDRADHWAGSDAVMASAFCPTGPERDAALAEVDRVSLQLLAELGNSLNAQHGLDADARFWRILLGHWINRYTSVLFHRWHAVRLMLAEHEIAGTIVFTSPGLSLAVNDTDSFTWACNDDVWNNLLIGDLVQRLSKVPIEYLPVSIAGIPSRGKPRPQGLAARAARLLQKDTDSLILNSYLPLGIALQVHLGLREVPQQRSTPAVPQVPADPALRARLRDAQHGAAHPAANPSEDFAAYARDMLFQMLPTCFLEGFPALHREVASMPMRYSSSGQPGAWRKVARTSSASTATISALHAIVHRRPNASRPATRFSRGVGRRMTSACRLSSSRRPAGSSVTIRRVACCSSN